MVATAMALPEARGDVVGPPVWPAAKQIGWRSGTSAAERRRGPRPERGWMLMNCGRWIPACLDHRFHHSPAASTSIGVAARHKRAVPSRSPDTMRFPSGDMVMQSTELAWRRANRCWSVVASQSLTVRSTPAVIRVDPSEEKAMDVAVQSVDCCGSGRGLSRSHKRSKTP